VVTKSTKKRSKKARKTPSQALAPLKTALETQLEASLELLERSAGGRQRLIDALAVSNHPSAVKFIAILQKDASDDLTLYEICRRIRTSPDEIVKIYTEGSLVRSTVETIAKLSDGMPSIMDVAISSAKMKGPPGFQDRKLLFEMGGLQKQEGGIHINNMNQMNLSSEGSFEKVVGRTGVSLSQNPFDIEAEEPNAR